MSQTSSKPPLIGKGTLELPAGATEVRYELLPGHDGEHRPARLGSVVALDGEGHGVTTGTYPLVLSNGSRIDVQLSPGIFGKASWEAVEVGE